MKTAKFLFLALLTAVFTSCASVQPCEPDTPSIVLKKVERRPSGLGHVAFPAGIYTPDFQSSYGVYYVAPRKLAAGGFGIGRPMRGGLFIPFPSESDQRQAAWYDQQENAGGLLLSAATSTTRLWRFNVPIQYETQR
jgi:hypothetical protein